VFDSTSYRLPAGGMGFVIDDAGETDGVEISW
jgi:hypothetical protein